MNRISADQIAEIRRVYRLTLNISKTSAITGHCEATVKRHALDLHVKKVQTANYAEFRRLALRYNVPVESDGSSEIIVIDLNDSW